jgi:hypothetical protein
LQNFLEANELNTSFSFVVELPTELNKEKDKFDNLPVFKTKLPEVNLENLLNDLDFDNLPEITINL